MKRLRLNPAMHSSDRRGSVRASLSTLETLTGSDGWYGWYAGFTYAPRRGPGDVSRLQPM